MSRIGRLPIPLVDGVKVERATNGEVCVSKGSQSLKIFVQSAINVEVKDSQVFVTRKNNSPQVRAWHGLYRKLIANAAKGLSSGWQKTLIMKGVGYKANVSGKCLELHLGYSHPVKMDIHDDLHVKVEKNNIIISGIDRAVVGEFAARVRRLREPEPYLGKGIRYSDEVIVRKAGKSGGEKSK